ncbi:MAG: branched-chain amino acid ABC transporter permease [Rhodospirillaceae bacterium]|nr:branched-chain amino acid ABC transporter permease [Rhodospirillaceae bacterium]MBT4590265.1 branched-chain amino acid ABC transporter permease [Rhodospirillaceae bacterium]MBT4940026.1 branched-chain amino acid ABC transporter permease [Rhodospirillaceae bacterium]MBT5941117.1 branched-chain amino acid ABC transporter permease [Rhodospirillaceae bacterium]MBT7266360.1 branched-chain amino acid ABC transporter permease [Rhodospirillaceae bacterium]
MEWANTIIQGILTGGLYAMFAAGLAIIFGIMRLVNITHGDLIVLAAFVAMIVIEVTGVNPFISMIAVLPIMFVVGYFLQRGILNFTLGDDLLPPLLVTFGISIVVQNVLLEIFTADSQRLKAGTIETMSLELTEGLSIGVFPLIIFITAVAMIVCLQMLFNYTRIGRAFRATSDDATTAQLMGINHKHIFGLAMGLALVLVAIAGVLMAVRTNFDPTVGPSRLLYAFEAVIMGGLGSLWGTLIGGIILGVAQNIGAKIDPGWQILFGHIAFLIVLVFRPNGLFPRTRDD